LAMHITAGVRVNRDGDGGRAKRLVIEGLGA
jgi:hypothetical protein